MSVRPSQRVVLTRFEARSHDDLVTNLASAKSCDRVVINKRMALRLEPLHASVRALHLRTQRLRSVDVRWYDVPWTRSVVRVARDSLKEYGTEGLCDSECRMNWHAEKASKRNVRQPNAKRSQSAKKVRSTQRSTGAETPTGTRPESPRIAKLSHAFPWSSSSFRKRRAPSDIGWCSHRDRTMSCRGCPPIGSRWHTPFWRLRPFKRQTIGGSSMVRCTESLWVSDQARSFHRLMKASSPGLLSTCTNVKQTESLPTVFQGNEANPGQRLQKRHPTF